MYFCPYDVLSTKEDNPVAEEIPLKHEFFDAFSERDREQIGSNKTRVKCPLKRQISSYWSSAGVEPTSNVARVINYRSDRSASSEHTLSNDNLPAIRVGTVYLFEIHFSRPLNSSGRNPLYDPVCQ